MDSKRLIDILSRVDEDHFAVIENDCAEIYSKKRFFATPTPNLAHEVSVEVECRKCKNCDLENDRCRVFGSDPVKAVKACAKHDFRMYKPDKEKTGD